MIIKVAVSAIFTTLSDHLGYSFTSSLSQPASTHKIPSTTHTTYIHVYFTICLGAHIVTYLSIDRSRLLHGHIYIYTFGQLTAPLTHRDTHTHITQYLGFHSVTLVDLCITLRVLLITPVTVASLRRGFSKLKLKKLSPIYNVKWQASGLEMVSIEKECAQSLDCDEAVNTFAHVKSRKNSLEIYE